MDGLIIDTEDIYTVCVNLILRKYGRPDMPWEVKAKLQGRPGPSATKLLMEWAQLPITVEEYARELYALHSVHFPATQPLPGMVKLLGDLDRTRVYEEGQENNNGNPNANTTNKPHRVHIALATSSHESNFKLKTAHLQDVFSVFETHRRVLGDDKRIEPGRGKPLPDIFLLALKTINESLPAGERPIAPEECLVFEDSVPGVEAGRRAGMRVVWCPHPMLKKVYEGREAEVLAGHIGEAGDVDVHQLGEINDGWADYYESMVNFPYEKYGITIPSDGAVVEGGVTV